MSNTESSNKFLTVREQDGKLTWQQAEYVDGPWTEIETWSFQVERDAFDNVKRVFPSE